MKWIIAKSTCLCLMAVMLTFSLTPIALGLDSPLDDIKAKLESEGISVVDYSNPQNRTWGSLPDFWIGVLRALGNESLSDFASAFVNDFTDLQDLRLERDQLEAQKSQAAGSERTSLDVDLRIKQSAIQGMEDTLFNSIADALKTSTLELSDSQIDEGAHILMNEIDFLLTSNQWGRLSSDIIARLKTNNLNSLSEVETSYLLNSDTVASLQDAMVALGFSLDEAAQIEAEVNAQRFTGEKQLNQVATSVAITLRNLIGALAVIWIVISGIRLVSAQGDETIITEQKRSILWTVIGLVTIILMERAVNILYGAPGVQRTVIGVLVALAVLVLGVVLCRYLRAIVHKHADKPVSDSP